MPVQSYRDLEVWQLAMDYVVAMYTLTERFPSEERFGLTGQLRRAAVAIPSNISEGHQQGTRAYLRYVVIAIGSLAECETQLEIGRRLKYATDVELAVSASIGGPLRRALFGLRRSLRQRLRLKLRFPDP
jgi:four helix bundle protein